MFLLSLSATCQVWTVSLKAGQSTYKGFAADCLQPPLRCASLRLLAAAETWRSGSSRQGCASNGVQVPIPSIARFRRLAYPGHGEVTTYERLGWKSHGCHTVYAVSVGAIWVASRSEERRVGKECRSRWSPYH